MTVGELRDILENLPEDFDVMIDVDSGDPATMLEFIKIRGFHHLPGQVVLTS